MPAHSLHALAGALVLLSASPCQADTASATNAIPPSLRASAALAKPEAPERERLVLPLQDPPARPASEIGPATERLLDMQRHAQSPNPRWIDGEQAGRSYQRYLKSFEFPIPERYDTGMDLKKQ